MPALNPHDQLERYTDEVLADLSPRERQLIKMRWTHADRGRKITNRQIAERLGLSESYVSRTINRGLRKLEACLAPAESSRGFWTRSRRHQNGSDVCNSLRWSDVRLGRRYGQLVSGDA
jgi:DNA-binding CsgD family transcriptional regulator